MPTKEQIKKMLDARREEILFMQRQMERFEMFTEKRMELIRAIMHQHPASIRDLANILNRDVKNVFDDLKLLQNMELVRFVRIGRRKRPEIRKRIIIISLE